uniref:Vacuolar protein sorting-associated protein VTA1 homolog n=1 Tax=Caligus clemensi TaxID=344056 RepID=C1C2K6_CALCM|nr:Vacuolar protein sorting-associated protein VTA1 homolog [Caligus clemensi]
MGTLQLAPIPPSLRPIAHYLKIATEHENRDPVVSYWARIHALESGMKLDKKSKEALAVLLPLMDWLEKEKKVLSEREEVTSTVVANAHLENYALKLFNWADREDRVSNFNKNVVKAFYTSGNIFEILTTFGETSPEISRAKKYAKWKAAYIHKCLKEGTTPIPGPMEDENTSYSDHEEPPQHEENVDLTPQITFPSNKHFDPAPEKNEHLEEEAYPEPSRSRADDLDPHVAIQVQKYCKYATNALDFANKKSAIDNLEKALHLLQTGDLSHGK